MKNLIFYSLILVLAFSCKHDHKHKHQDLESGGHEHHHHHGSHHHHGEANEYMNQSEFEDLVNRFESAERDEYQKPYEVIKLMGDITNMDVMEIGSGTGYFSFKLQEKGARVIAADVDERFQLYIQQKRDSLGISPEELSLRKVPYDSPNLKDGEIDWALIVNTYHHIEDRKEYLKKIKKGLKEGGRLMVVDFFKKETPVGPPVEMKLSYIKVKNEMQDAGFTNVVVNSELLPYQYIVIAD